MQNNNVGTTKKPDKKTNTTKGTTTKTDKKIIIAMTANNLSTNHGEDIKTILILCD